MEIEFLLASMRAIGKRHTLTKHFAVQLELDMRTAGSRRNSNSLSRMPIRGTISDVPVHDNSADHGNFEPIEGSAQASSDHETAGNGLEDILALARPVPGGVPCDAVTPEETKRVSSSESPVATFDKPVSWAPELDPTYASNQNANRHDLLFDDAVGNSSVFQNSSLRTFTGSMTAHAGKATGSSRTLPLSDLADWSSIQYPYRTADPEQSKSFTADKFSLDEPILYEMRNQWSASEGFAGLESMPHDGIDDVSRSYL